MAFLGTTLDENCVHCFQSILAETLILFGVKEKVITDKVLDLLIDFGKILYFQVQIRGIHTYCKYITENSKAKIHYTKIL